MEYTYHYHTLFVGLKSSSIWFIFPFPLSECVTSNPFLILRKCQQSTKQRSVLRTHNNWERTIYGKQDYEKNIYWKLDMQKWISKLKELKIYLDCNMHIAQDPFLLWNSIKNVCSVFSSEREDTLKFSPLEFLLDQLIKIIIYLCPNLNEYKTMVPWVR